MRISCAVPKSMVSPTFICKLEEMGLQPIVTNTIIRAVYEGEDHQFGTRLVELFAYEVDHDIVVDYCDEQHKPKRKKKR